MSLHVTMLALMTVRTAMHHHLGLDGSTVIAACTIGNTRTARSKRTPQTTSDPGRVSTYISPFTTTTTTQRRLDLLSHFRFDDSAGPINYAEKYLL
jgi:hypothetical protein